MTNSREWADGSSNVLWPKYVREIGLAILPRLQGPVSQPAFSQAE